MRTRILLSRIVSVAIFFVAVSSCNSEEPTPDCFPVDFNTTTGGSIGMGEIGAGVEGTYDGAPIDTLQNMWVRIFNKVLESGTDVDMYILVYTPPLTDHSQYFVMEIPGISLGGSQYDVIMDYSTEEATLTYFEDGIEHNGLPATIRGWIRAENILSVLTRCSYIRPNYECDLEVTSLVDGKELDLHIK